MRYCDIPVSCPQYVNETSMGFGLFYCKTLNLIYFYYISHLKVVIQLIYNQRREGKQWT